MDDTKAAAVLGVAPSTARLAVDVAVGSVAGRAHRRIAKPNQDAAAWRHGARGVVMVVCDGCGGGARSEVGAELTARLWLRALGDRVEAGAAIDDDLFVSAGDEVLAALAALCTMLGAATASACGELIASHLAATSLCAVVTRERAAVHAQGDGVIGLGREQRVIGPFADNQPPYLALGLVGARAAGETWIAGAAIGSALLATDGAAPLVTAAVPPIDLDADVLYRNPAALTRRLALLAEDATAIDWDERRVERTPALLDDDATIALARWSRR